MKKETIIKNTSKKFMKWMDILTDLSLKEIKAIEFRHVDGMSLADIGKIMGVTNERARQIIETAQRKIESKM